MVYDLFMAYSPKTISTAQSLRLSGHTYPEIMHHLEGIRPTKSTLSLWCGKLEISPTAKQLIATKTAQALKVAQERSAANRLQKSRDRLENYRRSNQNLLGALDDHMPGKLFLAALYLCEGSFTRRGSLMFGNSNPGIIRLFLKLLQQTFLVEESKFRCTVQCRSDHDVEVLERFWSETTHIPRHQFYQARVDARSIGKTSTKKDYHGVCRIDYFSADVYHELQAIRGVLLDETTT